MKVSISLPDDDVEFLDAYANDLGYQSRSAAVHVAVRLLHATHLGNSYEMAWKEWATNGDADAWDAATGDGVR